MSICKSYKSELNKNIQCSRKTIADSDFCRFHAKKKIYFKNLNDKKIKNNKRKKSINYFYKLLDEKYSENLMSLYDSFIDVPMKYLIVIESKVWDIRILLDSWAHLLCSTEMQQPSPIFPANPFTRKNINYNDICCIKNIIERTKLKIYGPLKYLLENIKNTDVYTNYNTDNNLSAKIINILEQKYRFKLLNIKNSQDCYTGIWINKIYPQSDFEVFYNYYDTISFQIIDPYGNVQDNYEKKEVKNMLDNYPIDTDTIYNDIYIE